ncbi:GNAT family N-acetyltransferase [Sanguibacter suaedae]|uniref:GNAT family N-acetyltransferase n=1 Tax=Sanguibacter suaedae TaxID=2795737 RepID=A0A934I7R5_9MICO|nr:GNAT family N-acetyltransferase [Sanguibacter suaedae]MBI9113765.1 GNAT family N-acetyltransferase [Sanguibacter suaedae]
MPSSEVRPVDRPVPPVDGDACAAHGSALVRAAQADDAADVWPLVVAFATTFTPTEATFRATFAALLSLDSTLLLVAETDGAVVGYLSAHAHLTFIADGEVVWVEELMVAEGHRGEGVGSALLAHAEQWAAGRGAAYVSLASRRAGPFYLGHGYDDSATFFRKLRPTSDTQV